MKEYLRKKIHVLIPIFAGEIKVGVITFYMSLNVKYSDLEPSITHLVQYMARELDVNASQVD